jgi:hypothetical protein
MVFKIWMGALALGAGLAAGSASAAPWPPLPAQPSDGVHAIQYWDYQDPRYAPRPRYRQPPAYVPPAYVPPAYVPPYRDRPAYAYERPRGYFYDREDAKEYYRDYRRAQKDMQKDRIRAWNRANGF